MSFTSQEHNIPRLCNIHSKLDGILPFWDNVGTFPISKKPLLNWLTQIIKNLQSVLGPWIIISTNSYI